MGLAMPECEAQSCLSPVRVCGFVCSPRHGDTSPSNSYYSPSYSDGHSPSHLKKVPASPLSAALREAQKAAVVTRPSGLRSLNIGKSRAFGGGLRKSCSSGQLQSLAEERELESLGLRSGSCDFRRNNTSPSSSHSNPISIPTPRALSSGRAASSHSMDLDEDPHEAYQHAGFTGQSQTHSLQPELQGHSRPGPQQQHLPQPFSESPAPSCADAAEPPQRVPSPLGVLLDEPGAVFMLEPASLPRHDSGRMCKDSCTRSQSAAVLSACG